MQDAASRQLLRVAKRHADGHADQAESDTHRRLLGPRSALLPPLVTLLGAEFVSGSIPIALSEETSRALAASSTDLPARGAFLTRGPLLLSTRAELVEDLSVVPLPAPLAWQPEYGARSICFELKPKSGLLADSPFVGSSSCKRRLSRFHLQQRTKLADGRAMRPSGYDPVAFFGARGPERARQQLEQLVQEPQNNLSVLIDGARVFGGSVAGPSGMDALAAAVAPLRAMDLLEALSCLISSSPLLPRVLALQQFDVLDIEGLSLVYGRVQAEAPDMPQDALRRPEALAAWVRQTRSQLATCSTPEEARDLIDSWPLADCLAALQAFVLAHAAKDLSLMVSLLPLEGPPARPEPPTGPRGVVSGGDRWFAYRVAAADLDPKDISKVPYWLAQDRAIVARYLGRAEGGITAPIGTHIDLS